MKLTLHPILAGLVAAGPLVARAVPGCSISGTNGDVPPQVFDGTSSSRIGTIAGAGNEAACRAACYSPAYPGCKTFAIKTTGGTSCYLYSEDLSANIIPRTTSYVYFPLPAGIRGSIPAGVQPDNYKNLKLLTYTACRGACLNEGAGVCKGFAYKPVSTTGGNCLLYNASINGKVKADSSSQYIFHQTDCA